VGTVHNAFPQGIPLDPSIEEALPTRVGFCTQIAVLRRQLPREVALSIPESWEPLTVVMDKVYERNVFDKFPPRGDTLADMVGKLWRRFSAASVDDELSGGLLELYRGTAKEQEENVMCCIPLESIWEYDYDVKKLCRFDKAVFLEVAETLQKVEFGRGMLLCVEVDTVGVQGGMPTSLLSYRFLKRDEEMHIEYTFSKESPEGSESDHDVISIDSEWGDDCI
jgi:hypothetical protein